MPGLTPRIDLTAAEYRQLQGWVRAGTTAQRLARRARLILGCAAGCGSRRVAQQERMSRTTVRRWIARFVVDRCTGLKDRPRRGRPTCIRPVTRALTVALACERPTERNVPLSRYSLAEIAAEVAAVRADEHHPSRSSIWRLLKHDALRPWRYKCWIFPRDRHFLELAGPVLDLYACTWQGQPLWADEYVLSADEKTSIQVRRRRHPTLPTGSFQATRVEHEYERAGALQYLAAWDVHRAEVFGRCEPRTGKAAFGRLVDQVMEQEPYRSARRVFWIVDNGSSHRGQRAAEELHARPPTYRHRAYTRACELAQPDRDLLFDHPTQGAHSERLHHARRACRPNPCLRSTLLRARQTLRLAFHAPGSRAALERSAPPTRACTCLTHCRVTPGPELPGRTTKAYLLFASQPLAPLLRSVHAPQDA
jgi:transposase